MGRTWRAGVAALAALGTAATSAYADGDRALNRTLDEDGRVVLLHSDAQHLGLTPQQHARSWQSAPRRQAAPRAGEAVPPATTWCGDLRATDDRTHGRTTLPRYKVVYAHASDVANRMASQAQIPGWGMRQSDVFQNAATWVADKMRSGSANTRGVRFDYGTSCGPQYLDILTFELPHPAAHYNGSSAARAERVRDDVLAARSGFDLDKGTWDWLVFADTGTTPGSYSYAEAWFEFENAADPNPATNPNAGADQMAIVYPPSYNGTNGIGYAAYTSTHEVLHTLGAVIEGAPHRTPGFHCTDLYSVLCYDDDGAGGVAVFERCKVPGLTPGSSTPDSKLEFDAVALDCGSDDYFSSDLGAFPQWNVNRNPAVCDAATCLASTIEPDAAVTGSPGAAIAGSPVRFDASASADRDGTIDRYDWDLDGDGGVEHSTAGPVLEIAPRRSGTIGGGRVVAVDDDGLTGAAALPAFAVAGRPPSMALAVPAPQPSGSPVVLDASGSQDPDEGATITSFRFTLPDGTSSTGASPRFTWTPQRPGRYEVRVTGTDEEGRSADATAAVEVLNRAPRVSASASPSRVAAGATLALRAAASDADGDVRRISWDLDGDGTGDETGGDIRVVFPDAGRRTVRVTVTDDLGATATATVAVTVTRAAIRRPSPSSALPSLRRSRSGRITARVRCTKRRTCRLRVSAGGRTRNVTVRARRTATVRLQLPSRLRARTVRFTLRDRATGRRLALRTLAAPRPR